MTRLVSQRFSLPAAVFAAGLLFTSLPAHAGIFDDDVARKQIAELQKSTSQTLIEQNRMAEQLSRDLAELRGQIEVLTNSVNDLEKRQKDLYLDLDTRLQAIETARGKKPAVGTPGLSEAAKPIDKADTKADSKPVDDASAALKAYENGTSLFKAGKFKEAASAFEKLVATYPDSDKAPDAQYWMGNSYFLLNDCKKVISSQQKLISKWPKYSRAPDALSNIAECQNILGQKAEAQKTLKELMSKYPDSKAAGAAKQQIKK